MPAAGATAEAEKMLEVTIMRDGSGLNQDSDSEAGEKWLNSGCIWNRSADKLDCRYERKESSNRKDDCY